MFYIAYMRQIEYPIIGRGKQCEESCMNDLQFKFIFIFTLKNYGLKIKEYGQPLLTRADRSRNLFGDHAIRAHCLHNEGG